MFLKFFCFFILVFSYNAHANGGYTDIICPKGTSPKVTKKHNEVKVICVDSHGKTHKAKHKVKKSHKLISAEPVANLSPLPKASATDNSPADQTIVRHYYVPLQKKVAEAPPEIEKREATIVEVPIKTSLADGFEGFFVGLMYNATVLNATHTYTTFGPNISYATGTQSGGLVEHGPLITLGYSSLFFDKKMVVGAEIRMGYTIPDSDRFNASSQTILTYYQINNPVTSIFNWPSVHIKIGPLLFERFLPYFIAGIGVYQANYNNAGQLQGNGAPVISSGGNQLSANFPVGVGLELAVHRNIHLRVEYLYTSFIGVHNNFATAQNLTSNTGINYNSSFSSHSILAGIMFCF